jgi:hypothetical protein
MRLPFTFEQFINVFHLYNLAVWPMQIVLNLAAAGICVLLFMRFQQKNRAINILLSLLWFWMGIVYQILFFSSINPAAKIFGFFFIGQAILFWLVGGMLDKIEYAKPRWSIQRVIGGLMVLYSLIGYPLLGITFGHIYPDAPTFGNPCPTTIFTLGILCFAVHLKWFIALIPFIWTLIGGSAAFKLGIREDLGLIISGIIIVIAVIVGLLRKKHPGMVVAAEERNL